MSKDTHQRKFLLAKVTATSIPRLNKRTGSFLKILEKKLIFKCRRNSHSSA